MGVIKFAIVAIGLSLVQPVLNAEQLSDKISAISALPVDQDYAAYLAQGCTSCHQSKPNAGTPVIEGMSKQHIVIALLLYKNGSRVNTTMTSIASGLGDEEIAALAEYFSKIDPQ